MSGHGSSATSGRSSGSEATTCRAIERGEAFAAWRRFLEAVAESGPAVLVFEDLHWADDGLLDFVDNLVDWVDGVPLLVMCTARPELLARRPGWGGGKRNATTVSLSPLADDDTASLVLALLDRPLLDADAQQALVSRAAGNPLYAEEFVRILEAGANVDTSLPDTIQGIVAARLDLLPTAEKELLQNAAVLGKVFWSDALASHRRGRTVGARRARSARWSGRSSSAGSSARPSRARASTRSSTRSCGTRRTASSRGRRGRHGTSPRRRGSSRFPTIVPRIAPRRWLTTI